eukprot:913175-Pleurochrysis_carterae.AAC.1
MYKKYDTGSMTWKKRVWYACPVTERVLHLPQPLVSRRLWFGEWRSYVKRFGLQRNQDGRVCERGLVATAQRMIERDAEALLSPSPTNKWILTFEIDYTAISGKRGFTHASLSLGAMYRQARRMQTVLKIVTLAVGQCHDDNNGLALMLTGRATTTGGITGGLASEMETLYHRERLLLADGREMECKIKCCLDLAAARELRGSMGETACLCACRAPEKRSYPGDNSLPDLPAENGLEAWLAARDVLRGRCSWRTELLSFQYVTASLTMFQAPVYSPESPRPPS